MVERIKKNIAVAIVLGAVLVAYSNGVHGVFVYDDIKNIVNNPDIREFGSAVAGTSRPLTNLTFYLQYKLGLRSAFSAHVFNIILHTINALLLWSLVWRVARHVAAGRRLYLASASALLWGVHPIHTEAVTYIVQRAEVLSSTFVLGGLLLGVCCVRGRRKLGLVAAPACFVLSYLTKPTAVMAPLLLITVDSVLAGGFRAAWRSNRSVHLLSMLSLLVPVVLLSRANESTTSAGFSMSVVSFSDYLMFQPYAILLYVSKLFWPKTLLIDYGFDLQRGALPFIELLLVISCFVLLFRVTRRNGVSRMGLIWFFAALLPVIIVPLADLFAEHRLYLASAGVAFIVVSGILELCRKIFARRGSSYALSSLVLVLALLLMHRTRARNLDYRDDLLLWRQVTEERPENVRGHLGVGAALAHRGELAEAERSFRLAVIAYEGTRSRFLEESFRTDYAYSCMNLSILLDGRGETDEAVKWREEGLNNGAASSR